MKTPFLLATLALVLTTAGCSEKENPKDKEAVDVHDILALVTPGTAFRFYSGNTSEDSNHPLMFAHGRDGKEYVTVVGRGCAEEFPIEKLDEAVGRYKKLLGDVGYRAKKPGG